MLTLSVFMSSHKYSPVPDNDPDQLNTAGTQGTSNSKMVTLATRIKLSKPVKVLGVVSFIFVIWIIYISQFIHTKKCLIVLLYNVYNISLSCVTGKGLSTSCEYTITH